MMVRGKCGDTRTARGTNTSIHIHPSTSIHPTGTALPWSGSASKEKQGAAQGCSKLWESRESLWERHGCTDWEFGLGIRWFFHPILQFWHRVLFSNPFIHHGLDPIQQLIGFLVPPKTDFIGRFLNAKSHVSFLIFL